MGDFPRPIPKQVLTPTHLHTYMIQAANGVISLENSVASPGSVTWVANQASFVPFTLPFPYMVRRVFWVNGATITSSAADFAIYDAQDGTRIFATGSVTLSGASLPQYVDATDFLLPAGRYYFAHTLNNTTARGFGNINIPLVTMRQAGCLQQATISPGSMPATMASAVAATSILYPLIGITRTASGF